jgi:hypothetical protein
MLHGMTLKKYFCLVECLPLNLN